MIKTHITTDSAAVSTHRMNGSLDDVSEVIVDDDW